MPLFSLILIATLFQTFTSLEDVVVAAFRRSLSIPLYRSWKLSLRVFADVKHVLRQGHRSILKCLLAVRATFLDGENRYLLNELYINDYCVWIQYASAKKLEALVACLEKVRRKRRREVTASYSIQLKRCSISAPFHV